MHVDDEVQPATLEQWLARKKAEFAAMRVQAHQELDAIFDAQFRRIELDAHRMARDIDGATQH